jgi:hypothetical protein
LADDVDLRQHTSDCGVLLIGHGDVHEARCDHSGQAHLLLLCWARRLFCGSRCLSLRCLDDFGGGSGWRLQERCVGSGVGAASRVCCGVGAGDRVGRTAGAGGCLVGDDATKGVFLPDSATPAITAEAATATAMTHRATTSQIVSFLVPRIVITGV